MAAVWKGCWRMIPVQHLARARELVGSYFLHHTLDTLLEYSFSMARFYFYFVSYVCRQGVWDAWVVRAIPGLCP